MPSLYQVALLRAQLDRHGFGDLDVRMLGGGDEWSRTSVKAPVVQATGSRDSKPRTTRPDPPRTVLRANFEVGAANGDRRLNTFLTYTARRAGAVPRTGQIGVRVGF